MREPGQNAAAKPLLGVNTIISELTAIREAISAHTQPVSVYLFGSFAYGQPTVDSDIDIYLVIPDTDVDILELGGNIRGALYKKLLRPLDLLIGKKSVFEKRRQGLTLENIVSSQGVLLYGN